jgi:L-gulono-1,4-lactone dehydrogenase
VPALAGRRSWRNWAGNQSCSPAAIVTPSAEDQLVDVVREAATAGRRVKVVGSGHSFTDIACTDGTLVDLARYGKVLSTDPAAGTVTVQAGITLARLGEELAARGLAVENLGDVAYQTVAGATSTGTHGTGLAYRGLAAGVVAMRLVLADGSVLACSEGEEAGVWSAARVGLGALGIVSTMTIRCRPAFTLHAVEAPMRMDEVTADLDGFFASADHVEFYWVPHTGWALTKRNTRTAEPPVPRSRWAEWRDDVLLSNVAFGAMCRLGRLRPAWIPRLAKLVPSTGTVEYSDRSDRVFTSPRLVRFCEMEYAVPREALGEALDRVRRLVDRLGIQLSFPVEVRVAAADDIPLSTASGRDTGYVAVHTYRDTPHDQYFAGVEAIMDDYGGRPHWGKLHYQTARTLAHRYPAWDEFARVRERLDPDRRFANPYLDRVLGP